MNLFSKSALALGCVALFTSCAAGAQDGDKITLTGFGAVEDSKPLAETIPGIDEVVADYTGSSKPRRGHPFRQCLCRVR